MSIRNKEQELIELSSEEKEVYERLFGNTPFSYFKSFDKELEIFQYYEQYAVELVQKTCKAIGQEFDISYQYLSNSDINAGCLLENTTNRIMVCRGTVFSLYEYAYKLAVRYKTIETKNKSRDGSGHTILITESGETSEEPYFEYTFELSNKIEDNTIAEYIAMVAIKFVLAHEIGHILNGHLLYRKAHGEEKIEFNMSDNAISSFPKMDLQSMEIDADSFAACAITSMIEKELLSDQQLIDIVDNKNEIYKIAGCAIQCVFSLIRRVQSNWTGKPENYTHPPIRTRVNLLLDTFRDALMNDEKWKYVINGCVITERNLNDYFQQKDCDMQQFVLDLFATDQYGQSLLANWRKRKKEWAKFTKMPFV